MVAEDAKLVQECTCGFCASKLRYEGNNSESNINSVGFEGGIYLEPQSVIAVEDYSSLLSGHYWSMPFGSVLSSPRSVFLTYSFPTRWPSYAEAQIPGAGATFRPLNSWEQSVVEAALVAWDQVSGVKFIRSTNQDADIEFSFVDTGIQFPTNPPAGYASYPSSAIRIGSNGELKINGGDYLRPGDVHFGTRYSQTQYFQSDFMHVALHEIGHALGLKHPHEGDLTLDPARNNGSFTVMGYNSPRSSTLGPLDIQAIQKIYGPNSSDGTHVAQWNWDSVTGTLTQIGTSASEYIRGTSAKDVVDSRGGRDAIVTLQGDDTIVIYGQAAEVNAGSGNDTLITGLQRKNIIGSSTDTEFRSILIGNEYISTYSVERFQFTDGTLAFDLSGNAGQVYRLYQAAFARTPDNAGLKHNIGLVDGGLNLQQMSSAFLASAEFRQKYGTNPTDAAYINSLYRNVLGRDADSAGLEGWQSRLADGSWTKTTVLVGFSESPENIAKVSSAIANGIWLV